ncbi:MAG: hydrogenase maturation protease [Methylacidiphilales bacterium]|nr:hydrogenase maturation protease [Candidatus Methylacidiphilales bacterium]
MTKGRKLIIGYGNPLRGDDGLGWEVAGRLAANILDESVAIKVVHQLAPELAEPISEAEMVIFVDASCEGVPGTWKCEEVAPASDVGPLGHHFNIAGLLAYAETLYHSRPQAFVVSVAAGSFECNDELTTAVEMALPEIVRYIRDKVCDPTLNPHTAHA